jgi:hypothetical protein
MRRLRTLAVRRMDRRRPRPGRDGLHAEPRSPPAAPRASACARAASRCPLLALAVPLDPAYERRWYRPAREPLPPEPGRLVVCALLARARVARGCTTPGDDRLETRAYGVKRYLFRQRAALARRPRSRRPGGARAGARRCRAVVADADRPASSPGPFGRRARRGSRPRSALAHSRGDSSAACSLGAGPRLDPRSQRRPVCAHSRSPGDHPRRPCARTSSASGC